MLYYWHTKYLPFTTNSLIRRACFHVPKYVCECKFRITLRWSRTVCHGVFSKSWTGYYIFVIIITNTHLQNFSVTVYIFIILYFYLWLCALEQPVYLRNWIVCTDNPGISVECCPPQVRKNTIMLLGTANSMWIDCYCIWTHLQFRNQKSNRLPNLFFDGM